MRGGVCSGGRTLNTKQGIKTRAGLQEEGNGPLDPGGGKVRHSFYMMQSLTMKEDESWE